MSADTTPKRRTVWLRRILRWIVRPVIVLCLLFLVSFYLFQEIVLFQSYWEPTDYVERLDIKPLNEDEFVEVGEAKINYQKFSPRQNQAKVPSSFFTAIEATSISVVG